MEIEMIMLVTYRADTVRPTKYNFTGKGHKTCIAPHRQNVVAVMEDCHPDLMVLDMYLADPSGIDVLKTFCNGSYQWRIVMLSGPSMRSVLHDGLPMGVDKVVHVPEQIAGRFELEN
jgi:DNA-binding response OmpR family regulator